MIIAVTGTGTEIGKTHVACALVGALVDRGKRVVAWKPVESGVTGERGADEALLAEACGIEAAPTIRLRDPLSPHLAARRQGIVIDPAMLRDRMAALTSRYDIVVVELAGGLFSPFDDRLDNAEWLARVSPRVLLVAPDRLGVLHDIGATVRAARTCGLPCDAIALVTPASPDAATGTNAGELRVRATTSGIAIHEVPRGAIAELRRHPAIVTLAERFH